MRYMEKSMVIVIGYESIKSLSFRVLLLLFLFIPHAFIQITFVNKIFFFPNFLENLFGKWIYERKTYSSNNLWEIDGKIKLNKIPKIIWKKISVYFIHNRHCKSNFYKQLNSLDCPKTHAISSMLTQTQEFIFR